VVLPLAGLWWLRLINRTGRHVVSPRAETPALALRIDRLALAFRNANLAMRDMQQAMSATAEAAERFRDALERKP
jgi:hypothetical protein